ncbi:hypothetical protein Y032_0629g843 [Ancylostoma ceylanicum]|uniref:NADH dehydrogenase [ubiquinone] 1 alpha subcomplex subunit 12 n=1 Tax=Ancylostoma ceylanicum TaxID=53326 RepID=A0A016WM73_9BILA|nr:hypothetical protein Y032_0629g843 [Ancylostoma ceylanicum]
MFYHSFNNGVINIMEGVAMSITSLYGERRLKQIKIHVWLDYDPTQIPPEWHRWLHHIGDDTPTQNPPKNEKWVLQHEENLSIFEDKKYIPYSTTRTKIQGWQPGQKKQQ